jgi:hypothetical protein
MKKLLFFILLLGAVGASAQKVAPKTNVTIVTTSSPLRKTFLDLSRPNADKFFGQSIEFLQPNIRLFGNYAFIFSVVQQKGGKELDSKKFKEADMPIDNNYQAVYLKKNGKWTILKESIGCTDVCWLEWVEDKTIPTALFPMEKK